MTLSECLVTVMLQSVWFVALAVLNSDARRAFGYGNVMVCCTLVGFVCSQYDARQACSYQPRMQPQ